MSQMASLPAYLENKFENLLFAKVSFLDALGDTPVEVLRY